MKWTNRSIKNMGAIMFRGSIAPRAGEFEFLRKEGFEIKAVDQSTCALKHPEFGSARMSFHGAMASPPKILLEVDQRLTAQEKQDASIGRASVFVEMDGQRGHVLRDRKLLLRVMRAIMGNDGLTALDLLTQRYWSRDALDDELSHDADLDIESLYTLHLVTQGKSAESGWVHTHGLREIGFFDFDLVGVLREFPGAARDAFRALAFCIVEGKATIGMPRYMFAYPGLDVSLIDAKSFYRRASGADRALRGEFDESHDAARVILCEPSRTGLLKWFDRPKLAATLREEFPDRAMTFFPDHATELMAERAVNTFERFMAFRTEFADLHLPALVKLGLQVDGGTKTEREHMWFEVHDCKPDRIDATLLNQPHGIASLKQGDRRWHGVEELTDWTIMTPCGSISPRDFSAAREIRADRDKVRQMMESHRKK